MLCRHFLESTHQEITRQIVADARDNWLVKGVRTDSHSRPGWNYLAYSPDPGKLVHVAVSIDDETILSAFQDRNATRTVNRGDRAYFARKYSNVEIRGEPKDDV